MSGDENVLTFAPTSLVGIAALLKKRFCAGEDESLVGDPALVRISLRPTQAYLAGKKTPNHALAASGVTSSR
jgi:hypothetical protein